MATYLNRSNFNGSAGSHFFLDLYYDVLSASSVRFYAYIGSVDGYAASGTSSAVYINGSYVGSISSIPARSNTLVGYLDVAGAGSVTATASCTTPWNGVGSASVSGSVPVGDFITSFNVTVRDETSVLYSFTTSSSADYAWWSIDGTNWYDLPNGGVVSGFTPGQAYNFYLRIRQTATQATFVSSAVYRQMYNYPYVSSAGNFYIGNQVTINLYNPLHRNCYVYLINASGTQSAYTHTTGTSVTGFNDANWKNFWYQGIPNSPNGTYKIRLYMSENGRDTTVTGGTYYVTGNEKPVVTLTAVDTDKTLSTSIEPTATVSDLTNDSNNKTIIKFISDITATLTASSQYSSTIKSSYIKCGGDTRNATQSSASITQTATFQNAESSTVTGYAKDSRELSNTLNATGLSLVPYVRLTMDDLELYRDDETSNTLKCKGSGNYYSGQFGSSGVNNSITFEIRTKESTSETWGSWTTKTMTIGSNDDYSFDFTVGTSYDYTKTYNVQVRATDKCMTTGIIETTAKPGIPIQGLFEDFHEAFGVKTFEKDGDSIKLNRDTIEKVVWTNSSISSAFTAQNIELTDNISDYKYYSILYTIDSDSYYISTGKIPISINTVLTYTPYHVAGTGTKGYSRFVTVDLTHNWFAISICYYTTTTVDNACKPYKIILYK